jgi:hypothetical protein
MDVSRRRFAYVGCIGSPKRCRVSRLEDLRVMGLPYLWVLFYGKSRGFES